MTKTRRSARTRMGLGGLLAIVGVLFLGPVVMLAVAAFRSSSPGTPGHWTTAGITTAWTSHGVVKALLHSVLLSTAVMVCSMALAVLFCSIVARTNTPGRRLVTPLMAIVFAMPQLYFAIAWGMLGNRQVGLLNTCLGWLIGHDVHAVNINSWPGLIVVMTLKMTASHYLLLIGPFLAMDRSVEEASRLAGASRIRTFLRINIPILMPGITGLMILAFVIGIGSLDTVLVIGSPAQIHVFATEIFGYINNDSAPNYSAASALSLLLVVIIFVLVVVQQRMLGDRRFTTVTGKAYRTDVWAIGAWRWACLAAVVVFAALALLLPLSQLVLGSFQPFFGLYGHYTLNNYVEILSRGDLTAAFANTFLLACCGGFIAMFVALLLLGVARRLPGRTTRTIMILTWLPWALPGVVLGLAISWAYLSIPGLRQLYGSIWILMIGLVVSAIPLAARSLEGAMHGVSAELEESARSAGAGPLRTTVGIVGRLVLPSFLAGWFITAMLIGSNFDVPVLLSSSTNPTIPIVVFQLYTNGDTALAAAVFCLLLLAIAVGYVLLTLLRRLIGASARAWDARQLEKVALHVATPGPGVGDATDLDADPMALSDIGTNLHSAMPDAEWPHRTEAIHG